MAPGLFFMGTGIPALLTVPFVTVRHLAFQVHLSIIIFLLRMLLLVCVYSRRQIASQWVDSESLDLPAEKLLWGVKCAPVSVSVSL